MKNILYLCAAKNETAMTKQFSFAVLCLLFLAACNKTPEPTPVPEPYNLAGKTYVYQGNHPCDFFMGRQIYELYVFLDESKVVNAKRLDSVNGEVLGINIDTGHMRTHLSETGTTDKTDIASSYNCYIHICY